MALGLILYCYRRCRIKAVCLPQPAMNGLYWISSRRSRSGAHARTDCSSVDTWLRMIRVGSYPQALWGPLTPLHPFRCRFFFFTKKKIPRKQPGESPVSAWERTQFRGRKAERETQRCQVVPTPVTRVPPSLALSGQCSLVSVRSSRSRAWRVQGWSAAGRRGINE